MLMFEWTLNGFEAFKVEAETTIEDLSQQLSPLASRLGARCLRGRLREKHTRVGQDVASATALGHAFQYAYHIIYNS